MKSDPPSASVFVLLATTLVKLVGPKKSRFAQSSDQKPTSNGTGKRKMVLSDDEDDDIEKTGNKEIAGKRPRQANPSKKKTSSRAVPTIRKSSRYESVVISPSFFKMMSIAFLQLIGNHPTSIHLEKILNRLTRRLFLLLLVRPNRLQKTVWWRRFDRNVEGDKGRHGNRSESEARANQEPPTRNQPSGEQNEDIPESEGQASSPPLNDTNADPEVGAFDKVEGPARPPPKIITGNNPLSKLVFRKIFPNCLTSLVPV